MRTSRRAVAGAASTVLLLGLSSAGLAQEASEPGSATYISGTRTWLESTEDGSVSMHAVEVSDPRASGTATESLISWQQYAETDPPSVTATVRLELVNDEGGWSGVGSGVYDPDMGWHIVGWWTGEGPYDGLTLYTHGARITYSTPVMEIEGVIFEGPAPAYVEAVQIPAE